MVYLTKHERSIIGSAISAFLQRKIYSKIIKLEIKRKEILKEIWSTEKYYNEQLCTIIDLFFKPMMLMTANNKQGSSSSSNGGLNNSGNGINNSGGNGNLAANSSSSNLLLHHNNNGNNSQNEILGWTIKENEIHSIFSHIENIYGLSNILFEKIDPRLKQWSPEKGMGDIFVNLSPFFKCYKQYSENYSNSIETLKNLRANNQQFNMWLKSREKDIRCKSLDLPSLLIAPIQRVPRYILLLEALYNATKPTHQDYEQCLSAATLLKNVAQVVNDGISEDQNRKKLITLQTIFDTHVKFIGPLTYPNLVEAHRKLIKEGKLQKKSLRDNSIQSRMVYLCNDILITISSITFPVSLNGGTTISKVDKIIPLVSAMTIFNSEDTNSFFLVSPIKTHSFVCESQQVRSQWLSEIQNAIVLLIENSPSLKIQRSQWELVHNNGKWKAVSTLPDNPDVNVLSSFESKMKINNGNGGKKQQQKPSPSSSISPNLGSSYSGGGKSPDISKFGSPTHHGDDKEWRHGVPTLTSLKSSSSFLLRSSNSPPTSNDRVIIKNNSNNHDNNNDNNQIESESEGEEYAL